MRFLGSSGAWADQRSAVPSTTVEPGEFTRTTVIVKRSVEFRRVPGSGAPADVMWCVQSDASPRRCDTPPRPC